MRLPGTVALAILATACSPTTPGPIVELAIQSVSPNTGPVTGGTEATIRGAGFAAGTSVTIGGRPASDVSVQGSDMLTVKTPSSSVAGTVDVVVSLGGRTDRLAGGFTYQSTAPNTAPGIRSITAQGRRLRQPPSYADYGETIQLALVVEDAETPASQLVYEWRACDGIFNGTGPQVEWTAPAIGSLPSVCTIEVIVLDGPHIQTRAVLVRLHNTIAEVGALALLFLEEFADNSIPAATTVRNFSDSCSGKATELGDVTFVRDTRRIDSHVYGVATVTVAFGGMCKGKAADACVVTPVEWRSTVKETGALEIATGVSTISSIYRDSRWWLCDSVADEPSSLRFWPMN
jgi:hypothetical protein